MRMQEGETITRTIQLKNVTRYQVTFYSAKEAEANKGKFTLQFASRNGKVKQVGRNLFCDIPKK